MVLTKKQFSTKLQPALKRFTLDQRFSVAAQESLTSLQIEPLDEQNYTYNTKPETEINLKSRQPQLNPQTCSFDLQKSDGEFSYKYKKVNSSYHLVTQKVSPLL